MRKASPQLRREQLEWMAPDERDVGCSKQDARQWRKGDESFRLSAAAHASCAPWPLAVSPLTLPARLALARRRRSAQRELRRGARAPAPAPPRTGSPPARRLTDRRRSPPGPSEALLCRGGEVRVRSRRRARAKRCYVAAARSESASVAAGVAGAAGAAVLMPPAARSEFSRIASMICRQAARGRS
jgi:hypothetical protein